MPPQVEKLFGRERELARLDGAWTDHNTKVLTIVAFGGVGKSALVNQWLENMGKEKYRGATRVYGCSFYSQGTAENRQSSAEKFLEDALTWFDVPREDWPESQWDRGVTLAEAVRAGRTLLLLDGLEPLQYPPGELEGEIKDDGIKALLKELARANPGLCLVTTRLAVPELAGRERLDLEHLSVAAGAELLAHLQVKGTRTELEQAAKAFDGHALALHLLATYLGMAHGGDVRQRDCIPDLEGMEVRQGRHARRVMTSYEEWFKEKHPRELALLSILGLFDRPVEEAVFNVLLKPPAIPGLTDPLMGVDRAGLNMALHRLVGLGLLAYGEKPGEYFPLDCHPLVREHFGAQLRDILPAAWQAAHRRLYESFRDLPKKHQPDTLEEMEPLFSAVAHGCLAGAHQEVLDAVYYSRIMRDDKISYCVKQLGALGADLAALASFFDRPWSQPAPGLTTAAQAMVLGEAGFRLRSLGRLQEAREPLRAGLEMYIAQEDWREAAAVASNLVELDLLQGAVTEAVEVARQGVEHADRSGDGFLKEVCRTYLAHALHQGGQRQAAETLFREAEAMQGQRRPELPQLYTLSGFLFRDLLLGGGAWPDVVERAATALQISTRNHWQLPIALDNLSMGQAQLGLGQLGQARESMDAAVVGLRKAGRQAYLLLGLLTRAGLWRVMKTWDQARRDLVEVEEGAERSGMRLHMADFHLESARLALDLGQAAKARGHLEQAKSLIDATGYGRRIPDWLLDSARAAWMEGDLSRARRELAKAKAIMREQNYIARLPEVEALEKSL